MRFIVVFLLLVTSAQSILFDPFSGKSIAQQRREQQFERCLEICAKNKETAKPGQLLCSQCRLPINPDGVFLP